MTPGGAAPTHAHSPAFLAIVQDALTRVKTLDIDELLARLRAGEQFILLDTREDREWEQGHLPSAYHMSKGVIERDIEQAIPDRAAPIVCYCGGGFRSALVCDNLGKMGYTNAMSLDGGWRRWNALGLPVVTPEEDPAP